jgi:hypothetical protein
MLLVGLARVLIVAAVALSVGMARALLTTARIGAHASRALLRGTGGALAGRADAKAVPARGHTTRAASQELVLAPKPRVPAQREPVKIHPVIVPHAADSPSSALVPRRSTEAVRLSRPAVRREVLAQDLGSLSKAFPREERRLRELVSQLQPLVHRVADRARWRRSTTCACERGAQTNGWRQTVRSYRTVL